MSKAWDIAAYIYDAEILCPACTIEMLIQAREASPGARGMTAEDALDQIAAANAIDRQDEHSFDSGDFPKVVFQSDIQDDECDRCRKEL